MYSNKYSVKNPDQWNLVVNRQNTFKKRETVLREVFGYGPNEENPFSDAVLAEIAP